MHKKTVDLKTFKIGFEEAAAQRKEIEEMENRCLPGPTNEAEITKRMKRKKQEREIYYALEEIKRDFFNSLTENL